MFISGKTELFGVIGDPIGHTLSPVMHNAAFKHLKLDFVFLAFEVKPVQLRNALLGMRSLGIRGLNVTMPHKNAVANFLDKLDPAANFIGSVNTILNNKGELVGFNTDGIGALEALKQNRVILKGKKVLLLGAGGAAKAVAFHIVEEVEKLVILNRGAKKALDLAEVLGRKTGKDVVGASLSSDLVQKNLGDSDVLINSTSVGMYPNSDQTIVSPKWLRPTLTVMDIIYNPIETRLVKDAKAKGAQVVSGLEMLVYQGGASFEIWTGYSAPVSIMKESVLRRINAGESN